MIPFIPSIEVLVKCLLLIAPYAVVHSPRSYSRLILCSYHPCLSSSASPDGVYKRLQRRLKQQQIVFVDLITPNISIICKIVEPFTAHMCLHWVLQGSLAAHTGSFR
ncbi:unnamed protein product [Urochloa humidicola]